MKIEIKLAIAGLIFLLAFSFCNNKALPPEKITVDQKMLDSIMLHSDSTCERPYRRNDFKTAFYYISKKDSIVTQVMKDRAGIIRQIIIQKNKKRIYAVQFFENGQLMYKYNFDSFGQYDGMSKEYYSSGIIRRQGIYQHGLRTGLWKNYDKNGHYVTTVEYNSDGQLVRSFKE